MKKKIAAALALSAALSAGPLTAQPAQAARPTHPVCPLNPNRYILSAVVTDTAQEPDRLYLTLEDPYGGEWYLYDWPLSVGQHVVLIVDDMGTPDDLCDDLVTDVLYCNDCACKDD